MVYFLLFFLIDTYITDIFGDNFHDWDSLYIVFVLFIWMVFEFQIISVTANSYRVFTVFLRESTLLKTFQPSKKLWTNFKLQTLTEYTKPAVTFNYCKTYDDTYTLIYLFQLLASIWARVFYWMTFLNVF